MKPTSISKIEYRSSRHDRPIQSNRAFPVTDHFFRPNADATLGSGRAAASGGDPARNAFRRMTAEMIETQNRRDRVEMIVFTIIIAIIAWPLISLLIVLAQTANG